MGCLIEKITLWVHGSPSLRSETDEREGTRRHTNPGHLLQSRMHYHESTASPKLVLHTDSWVGDHLRRKLVSSKSIVRLNRLLVQFIPRSACGDLHRTAEVVPPWIYSLRVYRVLLHYIAEHNSMFDCSRSSPTLIIPGTHQRRHERNVVLLVACQIARHLYLLS